MTGHHDPRFPDLPADLEDVTAELARYADVTEESAPGGFADRVMAAIAAEPAAASVATRATTRRLDMG